MFYHRRSIERTNHNTHHMKNNHLNILQNSIYFHFETHMCKSFHKEMPKLPECHSYNLLHIPPFDW